MTPTRVQDVEPNTPKWLALRKAYRTASELPIVMGLSPFTTAADFKLIKAGIKRQYYSAAMRLGHETEAATRAWASQHLAQAFEEAIFTRGRYLASLDGISADGTTVMEIKASAKTYADVKAGRVPDYYGWQIQQQLWCSGATQAYLIAFDPKTGLYACSNRITLHPLFKQAADDAWAAWEDMPMPDAPKDRVLDDDNLPLRALFDKLAQVKCRIAALEGEQEEIVKKIMEHKADDRTVSCNGHLIMFKKGAKRIDYKSAVPKGTDLAPFTTVGEPSWSLKIAPAPFEAVGGD